MSELDLAEVRARLEHVMDSEPREDWLEEAERIIRAHQNRVRRWKLYDVSTVGTRIRTAREVQGLSRDQLALRLDVNIGRISEWERGKRDMPARILPRIATQLRVTQAWLLMQSAEGGPPLPTVVLKLPMDRSFVEYKRRQKRFSAAQEKLARMRAKYSQVEPEGKPPCP